MQEIEDKQLQTHAREVGDYLQARLAELAARHALIGDVRGSGVFCGIEFVTDRTTKTPVTHNTEMHWHRLRPDRSEPLNPCT